MNIETYHLKSKDKHNNYISRIWWKILFIISTINIIFIINYYKNNCCDNQFHRNITLLSMVYVFIAAIRAIFPVKNVDRTCFYNSVLCSSFIDRFVATIAEICFILLVTGILKNITNYTTESQNQKLALTLTNYGIICAQIFCWLGSLTNNQSWNVMEESIWTICFIIITIILFKLYIYVNNNPSRQNNFLKETLPLLIIMIIIYILFMIINDVPMYFKRWKNNKKKYTDIITGFKNMFKCEKISQSYHEWKEDYLWIIGYFSLAVWFSIYLVIWHTKYKKLGNQ